MKWYLILGRSAIVVSGAEPSVRHGPGARESYPSSPDHSTGCIRRGLRGGGRRAEAADPGWRAELQKVAREQTLRAVGMAPSPEPVLGYKEAFKSREAANATRLLALILIDSPVAGFRPLRAARFFTWKMPRPLILTLRPFFN